MGTQCRAEGRQWPLAEPVMLSVSIWFWITGSLTCEALGFVWFRGDCVVNGYVRRNMWVAWWQINVEEDGQRGMTQRKDGGRCGQVVHNPSELQKQECAHPLPKARGGKARSKHLCKEWKLWVILNPDLTLCVCARGWMRQWVKAVLLLRIWKSNHRLWRGGLGRDILNETLLLHETKAEKRHADRRARSHAGTVHFQRDLCEFSGQAEDTVKDVIKGSFWSYGHYLDAYYSKVLT